MQRYKKAFLFILGFLLIPEILSKLTGLMFNLYDEQLLIGYFAFVFLCLTDPTVETMRPA